MHVNLSGPGVGSEDLLHSLRSGSDLRPQFCLIFDEYYEIYVIFFTDIEDQIRGGNHAGRT